MLAGHLVLAVVFIATGQWMLLLVVTFARWLAPWLSFMFIETQHSGLRSDVPDFRCCCRTVLLGPVTRFLYGSSGFRVGETDRGAPLEAAVTVQAHAVTCHARAGGGDGRHTV